MCLIFMSVFVEDGILLRSDNMIVVDYQLDLVKLSTD